MWVKYNIDGGDHPKTSMVNQFISSARMVRRAVRWLAVCEDRPMRTGAPPKQGKAKGVQKYALRSSSGVIEDHWKRTRGTSHPPEMGPGYYEPPGGGMTGTERVLAGEESPAEALKTSSFAGLYGLAPSPTLNVMAMTRDARG